VASPDSTQTMASCAPPTAEEIFDRPVETVNVRAEILSAPDLPSAINLSLRHVTSVEALVSALLEHVDTLTTKNRDLQERLTEALTLLREARP
jgi:hypothetical protein